MNMQAIEKINTEMQKNPTDQYTEIVGQYIIDRCTSDTDGALVAKEGKTLAGAMTAVMERAKKAKHRNYAVLLPAQVFGAVDEYFGMQTDEEAQERAMMAACGATHTPAAPPAAKKVALDLADFL